MIRAARFWRACRSRRSLVADGHCEAGGAEISPNLSWLAERVRRPVHIPPLIVGIQAHTGEIRMRLVRSYSDKLSVEPGKQSPSW